MLVSPCESEGTVDSHFLLGLGETLVFALRAFSYLGKAHLYDRG